MADLSDAYVIGLLSDIDKKLPQLKAQLSQGQEKAQTIERELSEILERSLHLKTAGLEHETQRLALSQNLSELNQRLSQVHQECASLKKRSEDMRVEMERVGAGAVQRQLRRERAKLLIGIEDREHESKAITEKAAMTRAEIQETEQATIQTRQLLQTTQQELDRLQSQLPNPNLYAQIALAELGGAHARCYLDHQQTAWRRAVKGACETMLRLHQELKLGRYRLDKNSELVGGRAMASAETLYSSVAIHEETLALELFTTMTDPNLYFHHIFNIFRVFALGFYLQQRHSELRELLQIHRYAEGLRGAYVQAFLGLLQREPRTLAVALKNLSRYESELWQDVSTERSAGVLNMGVLAFRHLAHKAQIRLV